MRTAVRVAGCELRGTGCGEVRSKLNGSIEWVDFLGDDKSILLSLNYKKPNAAYKIVVFKKLIKGINMERVAIYPGSFDPVTNGHLDILERGLKLFDKIILAILTNPKKNFLFTLEQRIEMLEDSLKEFSNVEIDTFEGLTVDFAAQRKAQGILRGLRAMSDFEYEFQMALMNRRLNREVQTVFLMTGLRWIYTSSSIIKEAALFGGNIEGMVPPIVEKKIKEKYAQSS